MVYALYDETKKIIMKLFSKIILGAFLFTSSSAIAQGKSGGSNGKNKAVIVKSSNGSVSANQHASETGQIHASDRSILNRAATPRVRKHSHNGRWHSHGSSVRSHSHTKFGKHVKHTKHVKKVK